RLLSARIALLQRDGRTYRQDLGEALEWLERFYDTRDPGLAGTLDTIRQLAQGDVGVDAPGIDASLNAVRDYKLTRGEEWRGAGTAELRADGAGLARGSDSACARCSGCCFWLPWRSQ